MADSNGLSTKTKVGGWSIAGTTLAALLYALLHGGGKPAPLPTTRVFDVVLCADGPDEQHGPEFVCAQRVAGRVSAEKSTEQWQVSDTDATGYVTFAAPPVPAISRLKLEASGYETRYVQGFRYEGCAEGCHNVYRLTSSNPPPPPELPNAGERLPLHMDGTTIRTSDDKVWRYAGHTAFRLYKRFVDGEDIDPIITDYITCGGQCEAGQGPNTLRVLLSASALFDLPTSATTPAVLNAFLDKLASRGVRCECVVVVDANPDPTRYPGVRATAPTVDDQRAFLARVGVELAKHPLVIGEACNECSHLITRIDRGQLQRPPGAILWERGSGQANEPPFVPTWDLVGHHDGREDDWPRRLSCRDIRSNDGPPWGIHTACIENEDMGADDTDQPGRRTSNADDLRQHAVHCGENANGCLFHPEVGLQTTRLTVKQAQLAAAFYEGLRFAPPDALLLPYRRGGLSGPQAACIAHDDAKALRTFSKATGSECWTVAIRPAPDWTAVGVDGWRVVAQPKRGLVRLER